MSASDSWLTTILDTAEPADTWSALFARLKTIAASSGSPIELHNQTQCPDRLLAESAWELWQAYPSAARRASQVLMEWWQQPQGATGKAVLVLDALSLRELAPLLGGANIRGVRLFQVSAIGSEIPSDTDQFAKALGVPSRASLKNNASPSGFVLARGGCYTDVLSYPFEDCLGSVPHEPNIFLWHMWLDDLIHVYKKLPDQIYSLAAQGLQSDAFWAFVDRLRQGRRLVITADHGYAVARLFSTEEKEESVVQALREVFGASRSQSSSQPWPRKFMPPLVLTAGGHHMVMGQRKWKVRGGFPHADHGGLTLLEVAVPFVELPPL